MKNKKNKTDFIKKHEYAGGNVAFKNFISKNLQYPIKALENNIEGSVFLSYEVGFNGIVENIKILKGIGFGCDEEAVRLISLIKYEPQNNHGVKIISKHKIKINFKLPIKKVETVTTNYTYTITKKPTLKVDLKEKKKNVFNYNIDTTHR